MTITNETLSRVGYCARLEDFQRSELLKMGLDGSGLAPTAAETALGITAGDIAAQALELALDGYVTFKKTFTCSTNDAVTLELVARGVSIASGTWRRIDCLCSSGDDAGVASFTRRYGVLGASTPVLDVYPLATVLIDGSPAAVVTDLERTATAAAEAQTFALAAGSGTLTVTYTGQSSDVTSGFFEVRVYPKQTLVLA